MNLRQMAGDFSELTAPKRIVVAMSGGVDSSVAAALLVKAGHDVVGMMMRLWSEPETDLRVSHNRCCTPDQIADARRVAQQLDIPFFVLDSKEIFYQAVVQPFIQEHEKGRTPNPCIECNRTIRFNYLLEQAMAVDADYLATGHYARIRQNAGQFQLLRAHDLNKDQSYVLHVLGQRELARSLFPVGGYRKEEVRKLAQEFGLTVAEKSESMDLCFLADGNYRRFLDERTIYPSQPGLIETSNGDVVGRHQGLSNHTIGQRKGLGIALGRPMFVISKDVKRNVLTIGSRDEVMQSQLHANRINWLSGEPPAEEFRTEAKIRYRANAMPARVKNVGKDEATVVFDQPVFGVTPGQGVTFYDQEVCLGGGIIVNEEQL
jgi:tRNA-specific 2-thiouridylase